MPTKMDGRRFRPAENLQAGTAEHASTTAKWPRTAHSDGADIHRHSVCPCPYGGKSRIEVRRTLINSWSRSAAVRLMQSPGAKRLPCPNRQLTSSEVSRQVRGVAQSGSAPGSGPGGRRFESSRPDHSSGLALSKIMSNGHRLAGETLRALVEVELVRLTPQSRPTLK